MRPLAPGCDQHTNQLESVSQPASRPVRGAGQTGAAGVPQLTGPQLSTAQPSQPSAAQPASRVLRTANGPTEN